LPKKIKNYDPDLFAPVPAGMFGFEKHYWDRGYKTIAGVDEAGRGPLAGPVMAAAVILTPEFDISGIDDSKKLSEKAREALYERITAKAKTWAVALVDAGEIDRINILQSTKKAMVKAIHSLKAQPDYVLVDGNQRLKIDLRQQTIVGGDGKSASIAAASILAKVARDRLMARYHEKWPEYDFLAHKGYATKKHMEAIKKYGPCPMHRMTFNKVKEFNKK